VYAVSLRPDGMAVAGGGSEESFVGIPVYFYDFPSSTTTTYTGKEDKKGTTEPDVTVADVKD
jgi:hypothetical protein